MGLNIYAACGREAAGGISLDLEEQTGNTNFYKSVEGFLEALPQAVFQLAIVIRSASNIADISKFEYTRPYDF